MQQDFEVEGVEVFAIKEIPIEQIKVLSDEKFFSSFGGGGSLRRLIIEQTDAQKYGIPQNLLLKTPHMFGTLPKDQAREYCHLWETYKQAGIPVVDRIWMTSRGRILVPDLTADGSWFYGKSDLYQIKQESRSFKATDVLFLAIPKDEIVANAERIVEVADKNKLTLPIDDYFEILVHPDRRWTLMVLDIDMGNYKPEKYEDVVNSKAVDWLKTYYEDLRWELEHPRSFRMQGPVAAK